MKMDCEKIEEQITEFVDHELNPKHTLSLSRHLRQCHNCQSKLEDLLKIRVSIQFGEAIDPAPAPDENFAGSVMAMLKEEEPLGQRQQETFAGKLIPLMTLRIRWLVPALAVLFLLILPISMLENKARDFRAQPAIFNVAENKGQSTDSPEYLQSELDEYIMSHSQYASESNIAYPIIYASY